VNAPEPVNEDDFKAAPEIRGGNRPADYIPTAHDDSELEDGAESYGEEGEPE
jgi:hypothetical protein